MVVIIIIIIIRRSNKNDNDENNCNNNNINNTDDEENGDRNEITIQNIKFDNNKDNNSACTATIPTTFIDDTNYKRYRILTTRR